MNQRDIDPDNPDYEELDYYDPEDDAEALASAGWGTDEDYGGYTDML